MVLPWATWYREVITPAKINAMRFLFLFAACSVLLSACDLHNPAPDPQTRASYEATRMAVTKVGEPLEVEGCKISVHRVSTAAADKLSSFTMAVAHCPTATVTSTSHGCGKRCVSNHIVVEPSPEAEAALSKRKAEAEAAARLKALRSEAESLSKKIQALEQQQDLKR